MYKIFLALFEKKNSLHSFKKNPCTLSNDFIELFQSISLQSCKLFSCILARYFLAHCQSVCTEFEFLQLLSIDLPSSPELTSSTLVPLLTDNRRARHSQTINLGLCTIPLVQRSSTTSYSNLTKCKPQA